LVFGLSLTDHLRLTFGHVVYSHRAHATTAFRHSRWDRGLKTAEALLMLTTAVASAVVAFTVNPQFAIAAAAAATLAMGVLVVRLALDFERTALAHHACSSQLWHLREQYRSVLSDLKDGVLSVDAARDRRDYLMAALHRIYDNAPPADRERYQTAKQSLTAVNEAKLTDEEIDQFLSPSLQKAGSATNTSAS
jgi:hypothetical protein